MRSKYSLQSSLGLTVCAFVLPLNTLKTCLYHMLCGYKKESGEPSGYLGSWNHKRNRWWLKRFYYLTEHRVYGYSHQTPSSSRRQISSPENLLLPWPFFAWQWYFSQVHSFRDADVSPVRYRLGQLGSPLPSWFLYRSKAKNALPCVWFVYWHSNPKSSHNILRSLKRRNFRE